MANGGFTFLLLIKMRPEKTNVSCKESRKKAGNNKQTPRTRRIGYHNVDSGVAFAD
jgi:hypothetical protein